MKTNKKIKIRNYRSSDARFLADIYYHTIHNINIRDYSEKQVNAWAPESCLELYNWKKKWKKLPPIVATNGN
jgi:putative acetyltransferase